MADRKIIAVLGATGAQGGGLVRAIQADPGAGFVARAVTRDVNSPKAKALAALGAEVVAADVDDAASLERAFAGAHGAYCVTFFWDHFSPSRENAEARNMAAAAKAAEPAPCHLVHAGGHAPLGPAERRPHADADGPLQGSAFRRPRGIRHLLHRSRRADDVSADEFLLGEFHLLRHGSEERAGRQACDHAADGRQAVVRHRPPETSASARSASSRAAPPISARLVGIAGEHLTGTQMAASFSSALGQEVALQRGDPRRVSRLRIPGCRRPRKHVPVLHRVRGLFHRCARPAGGAGTESRTADFRRVARRQQGPHSRWPDPGKRRVHASFKCGVTANVVPAMSMTYLAARICSSDSGASPSPARA